MRSEKEVVYTELLVLRCQRKDRAAWDELIRMWERPLLYYLRRLVENEPDAWDLLQETWIKVLRSVQTLRETRRFAAWVYRIARNTAISHLRKVKWDEPLLQENEPAIPTENANETFTSAEAERVHEGLKKLALPHREVLTLFFLEDVSIEDIAEILEVPSGTVKSRLHYAKRALRLLLEKEEQ